jgi:hypothetical protein
LRCKDSGKDSQTGPACAAMPGSTGGEQDAARSRLAQLEDDRLVPAGLVEAAGGRFGGDGFHAYTSWWGVEVMGAHSPIAGGGSDGDHRNQGVVGRIRMRLGEAGFMPVPPVLRMLAA